MAGEEGRMVDRRTARLRKDGRPWASRMPPAQDQQIVGFGVDVRGEGIPVVGTLARRESSDYNLGMNAPEEALPGSVC
jgi:hypothetical protein